jgi:hypothetical protein
MRKPCGIGDTWKKQRYCPRSRLNGGKRNRRCRRFAWCENPGGQFATRSCLVAVQATNSGTGTVSRSLGTKRRERMKTDAGILEGLMGREKLPQLIVEIGDRLKTEFAPPVASADDVVQEAYERMRQSELREGDRDVR